MELAVLIQAFEPIMDPTGEAYIQVCTKGAIEPIQLPLEALPARRLIRAELSRMLGGVLPTDHQTRSCMDVLWAWAFYGNRTVAALSLEYLLTYDPVAQAIMALYKKGGAKQPAKPLLSTLARIAKMEDIDITKGNWPANEDALGCRLRAFVEPFAKAGIAITYDYKARPRTWCIPPRIRPSGVSDSKVSDATAHHVMDSASPDTLVPSSGTPLPQVTWHVASVATESARSQEDQEMDLLTNGSELPRSNSWPSLGTDATHEHDRDDEIPSDEEIQHLWETTR